VRRRRREDEGGEKDVEEREREAGVRKTLTDGVVRHGESSEAAEGGRGRLLEHGDADATNPFGPIVIGKAPRRVPR